MIYPPKVRRDTIYCGYSMVLNHSIMWFLTLLAGEPYIGIKTVSKKGCYAYFVPLKYKVEVHIANGCLLHANREGVIHGQGDYLVCSADENGKPDLANIWVVNGMQFEANYDMTDVFHYVFPWR